VAALLAAKRIDEACDRFEKAWRAADPIRIEDFLAAASEPERANLLRELLALEVELRASREEVAAPADYKARFPDYLQVIEAVFSLPEDPLPLPEMIGRYRVLGLLGQGNFGVVYLADDDRMGRKVAIKVPNASGRAADSAREEFIREEKSVARLQHDGIVRAYDFGHEPDGRCYIVFEYIEGMTLAARLKEGAMPSADAARIAAQVAEALHHALISESLVHRDIKPANILLDRAGNAKVADFGLALREEELAKQRGQFAGTLPYMSPEQVLGNVHHLDGRSDVYSLGVVLYEMLCGRRPFDDTAESELIDQILHREAKPPRQIDDTIPRELERVCLKALSKQVAQRYNTADDMARSLRPFVRTHVPRPVVTIAPSDIVPLFGRLADPSEAERARARERLHAIGWENVAAVVEDVARRNDAAEMSSVLDGLAAFEAHREVVGLLDRLVVLLKGDLRNRSILLLERKRLGLELEAVTRLFREIQSPYKIVKALGQGLYSASYFAQVEGADLNVVVRVLRPDFVSQPHIRSGYMDLSQKALQVVHENLVLTREARAFPDRGMYFAVRDYVDGVTLQKALEGGKEFHRSQIVRLLRRLAVALGAIHRRGLCHGAVKPSNIFLSAHDDVVLGDLSLPVSSINVTLPRLSYDYRYTAPEVFQSGGVPGPPSDFYALGCVAYELACGEPPFVSDNCVELAARHVHDQVVPPQARGSRLGPAWDAILLKLLARSPADRYQGAEEVVGELEQFDAFLRKWEAGLLRGERHEPLDVDDPLMRDASLMKYQGAESVMSFDPSEADLTDASFERRIGGESPMVGPPQLPQRIGDYDVLEVLGRGGMGNVYKAIDPRLQRTVAVKMLGRFQPQFGEAGSRLLSEARSLARLHHPNIVQIYHEGEHEGIPYLVLEYVDGGNLQQKLRSDWSREPRITVELVIKLARGVEHAHSQGVMHRDLKPSNVLLTAAGEPKIADFGLAKLDRIFQGLTHHAEDEQIETTEGTILGTPAYMSPEQTTGDNAAIGVGTDIHGLGVILFTMLAGRLPWQGNNHQETMSLIATQSAPSPRQFNSLVTRDLETICLKCLQKSPERRYLSAAELADELERWLRGGPPVHAASRSWWGRLFSFRGRAERE
jgi:serine/threonine protein kinase